MHFAAGPNPSIPLGNLLIPTKIYMARVQCFIQERCTRPPFRRGADKVRREK